MRFSSFFPATPLVPTLDPPASPAELAWWQQAKVPLVRVAIRKHLVMALMISIAPFVGMLAYHPARFFTHLALPLLGLNILLAPLSRRVWKTQEPAVFKSVLQAKRLRDDLIAEGAADEGPAARPTPRLS